MEKRGLLAVVIGLAGAILVGIGIVYLTVACESLPGILGPSPGETAPRTPLGVVCVVLGLAVLAAALLVARRGSPGSPAG